MADDDIGLMTTAEVARLMGVSHRSVYTLVESGELQAIRVGNRIGYRGAQTGLLRITRASYRAFLERRVVAPKS